MNDSSFDDLLVASLDRLKTALATNFVARVELAPIVFLRDLLTNGRLRDLRFDPETEPQPALASATETPSMEILETHQETVYRVSHKTREAMAKVATEKQLDARQIDWMIDNYFVHELIHYDQGMSGGNHSGLREQAPQVLLAIDYQADALAVIVATVPRFPGFRRW